MPQVSAAGVNYVQRTPEECEIRWLGGRHPDFNHSPWSQDEINKVRELIGNAKEGEVDWVEIATKLEVSYLCPDRILSSALIRIQTRRTPVDCMRHAIPRKMHVWTPESDERLLEAVTIYGTGCWLQGPVFIQLSLNKTD